MNAIEGTDLFKKISSIFKDESIEFIKRIANEIILEIDYDNYMKNIDIDDDDMNTHYDFIDEN